jgi:hypothetical protein
MQLLTNDTVGCFVMFALQICWIAGHGWGSTHDPFEGNCAPSSTSGGKYIMYAYAVTGLMANNLV